MSLEEPPTSLAPHCPGDSLLTIPGGPVQRPRKDLRALTCLALLYQHGPEGNEVFKQGICSGANRMMV